ncbi:MULTISPECIES: O-antigen translocase [Morganella]|nr:MULTISPECIES: O-antigen translocase [unclassified Morganella (in: enterobacteria)]BEP19292.1 O-antigen translocase [Morganella morganii subsp. sibonii]HDS6844478.1 O-antigen translocase [Morganella morganii subsp. morganii]HDU8311229.1 O-antigen translocase [Morganella morganii subsp. sibonii]
MGLFKTSILNGIAVLIKTLTMFVLNKILAIYVGPAGYTIIGQFQNFIQMVTSFSGSAINTGIIKYTAEYYDSPKKQKLIWQTAGSLIFILSIIFSILILIFKAPLSNYIFKSSEYQSIFIWLAIFLIFFNFNAFFLAILNGKKEIVKLITANILGSLFSLIITSFLAIQYNLYGALIALSIYQSIVFIVTFTLCLKSSWFKVNYLFGKINKKIAKNLSSFVLMALVSAICVPLSQITIRYYLMSEYNLYYAGYWEAMTRLSTAYLMFVTTTLGVYYLPRFAELQQIDKIKKEVYRGYKFILPLTLCTGLTIYLLRDFVIKLLFSESFLPMEKLFLWQMIGDSLKIGSWILSYLMLSKAMTKTFIITEIVFALNSILLTVLGNTFFGFEGVSIAYMVNYALYWAVMAKFIFRTLNSQRIKYE